MEKKLKKYVQEIFRKVETVIENCKMPISIMLNQKGSIQKEECLHKELSKQAKIIDEAQKYQKEGNSILADNQKLHNTVRNLEYEYTEKKKTLENEFKNKSFDLEY